MKEARFVRIICVSLKIVSWMLLAFGIFASLAYSMVLAPLLLTSRWSAVVLLFFFILIFLFVNLIVKIAEMLLGIKEKLP